MATRKKFNAPAVQTNAIDAITSYAEQNPVQQGGGLPYLRLLKGDGWFYGQGNEEVEDGSQWAMNIETPKHGWVSWTDHKNQKNERVGEVLMPLNELRPPKEQLEDTGWGWDKIISIELTCVSGVDEGTSVEFSTNSKGGIDFCENLFAEIGKQKRIDPVHVVPAMLLKSSFYDHKVHGRVYKPEFEITGWAKWGETKVKPAPKQVKKRARKK